MELENLDEVDAKELYDTSYNNMDLMSHVSTNSSNCTSVYKYQEYEDFFGVGMTEQVVFQQNAGPEGIKLTIKNGKPEKIALGTYFNEDENGSYYTYNNGDARDDIEFGLGEDCKIEWISYGESKQPLYVMENGQLTEKDPKDRGTDR
jgi:hypothetical protein